MTGSTYATVRSVPRVCSRDQADSLKIVWNYDGGPVANVVKGVPCKRHIVKQDEMLGGSTKQGVRPEDFLDIDG